MTTRFAGHAAGVGEVLEGNNERGLERNWPRVCVLDLGY
jgi:hypothetical protein